MFYEKSQSCGIFLPNWKGEKRSVPVTLSKLTIQTERMLIWNITTEKTMNWK